jgi:RND family efflux transporter MFP subunit
MKITLKRLGAISVVGLFISLGGVGLISWPYQMLQAQDKNQKQAASTSSTALAPQQLRGLVAPIQQVTLHAPLQGVLAEIAVKEGQSVKAGQMLARMDDTVQKAMTVVAGMRAKDDSRIRQKKLLLAEIQAILQRTEQLQKENSAQEWEVRFAVLNRDQAKTDVEAAEYQQALAGKELLLEEAKLTQFTISSPFEGQVVRILTVPGDVLTQTDSIMMLVSLKKLDAELFLPVTMFGKLKVDQNYEFMGHAPVSRKIVGRLKYIEPLIDPASQTFRCVFEIDNADKALPGGFSVSLIWPRK